MRYVDAHNHLHDHRLLPFRDALISSLNRGPIVGMVINGTRRSDWDEVAELAARVPGAIPSFGYHPWFLEGISERWSDELTEYLSAHRGAIGEIGIDHWRDGIDQELQESVFRVQIDIARALHLPVTIHGLKAWQRVLEILRDSAPLPAGFLLHSYAGPKELIEPFAELGGYFSCSGAFLHPKRERTLRLFSFVPEERLLIESDAPDQTPPQAEPELELIDTATAERLTHPLSLVRTYTRVGELRGIPVRALSEIVERNFSRLFGRLVTPAPQV